MAYGSPIAQFHRYRYANNNPYLFVDRDGREVVIPWGPIGTKIGVRAAQAGIASQLDSPLPGPGDAAAVGILLYTVYEVGQIVWQANQNQQTETPSSSESPPEPGGLVGEKPRIRGSDNSAVSGVLKPEFGGVGNGPDDLETLAGEVRSTVETDHAPLGAFIGQNGIFGREKADGGYGVDISRNGNKPRETLHHPKQEQ